MRYFFANTFFIVALLFPAGMQEESEWELKKDEEGIKVYTREVANSAIKEFKVEAQVPASQKTILNILLDITNYPLWVEGTDFARLITKNTDSRDFYYQLSMPWPIKDRDVAMTMKAYPQKDGSLILKSVSHPELIPEKDDFIRMINVTGYWLITPVDESNCHLTYQFLADPEGNLPAWLINIFIVDSPFKTLKNLTTYAYLKQSN